MEIENVTITEAVGSRATLRAPEPIHSGDYSDEDAVNFDTDKFDRRKIRVQCPTCKRKSAFLCSTLTQETSSGWRWVGCDHREPYATFRTKCRCGQALTFTLYTPQ